MPSCLRTIILFLHVASGMKSVDTPGLVQRCPSHSTFISPVNKTPEYLNSAVCSVLYNSQLCGFSAIRAGVRHQRYNLTLYTVLLLITLTWPNISVLFVLGRLHYRVYNHDVLWIFCCQLQFTWFSWFSSAALWWAWIFIFYGSAYLQSCAFMCSVSKVILNSFLLFLLVSTCLLLLFGSGYDSYLTKY